MPPKRDKIYELKNDRAKRFKGGQFMLLYP